MLYVVWAKRVIRRLAKGLIIFEKLETELLDLILVCICGTPVSQATG